MKITWQQILPAYGSGMNRTLLGNQNQPLAQGWDQAVREIVASDR